MNFPFWDQFDSLPLLEAAYLWCGKEPVATEREREQRPSIVDAVLEWLITVAKMREFPLVPDTFGISPKPDEILYIDARSRVQRDQLRAWAQTKKQRPLFLFPEDRATAPATPTWEGFDEDSDTYPPELDIALQVWRAVTNNPDPRLTTKEQIERWLKEHYCSKSLSEK